MWINTKGLSIHLVDRVIEAYFAIYNKRLNHGQKGYREYLSSIVLAFTTPHDGIVIFFRDSDDHNVLWIDGHSRGFLPTYRKMKSMLAVAAVAVGESGYIKVNTARAPKMARYWRKLGFTQIDENTMAASVKLNGN